MSDVYQASRPTIEPYRKYRWKEDVAYVFPQGMAMALAQSQLSGEDIRFLCGLMSVVGWGNVCTATMSAIARSIGMHPSNTTRSMRRLVAARLAISERVAHEGKYRITLSPELLWKGRPWHISFARMAFSTEWRLQYGDMVADTDATRVPGTRAAATGRAPGGGEARAGPHPFIPYGPRPRVSSPT